MIDQNFPLPPEMEPFRQKIWATKQPCVHIRPRKNERTEAWQSKIGGAKPYCPMASEWPLDSTGKPLFLLAQLNFEETPRLDGFPEKGLLQFWIGDDEYFGADLDAPENQADFRVRFFPEIEKDTSRLRADFPDWASFDMPLPTDSSFSLDFEATEELMSVADFRFENEFGADFFEQFDKRSDAVWEEFEEISSAPGHKIGGYPHFSQEDPRFEEAHPPTVLLFQLDSDDEMDLMWGDAGVANFFIREADLARLDFSHVHFNWDCY